MATTAKVIESSFLDLSGPCSTFWRDRVECTLKRNRLYSGGHVCTRDGGHGEGDGHRCACGHEWHPFRKDAPADA